MGPDIEGMHMFATAAGRMLTNDVKLEACVRVCLFVGVCMLHSQHCSTWVRVCLPAAAADVTRNVQHCARTVPTRRQLAV